MEMKLSINKIDNNAHYHFETASKNQISIAAGRVGW